MTHLKHHGIELPRKIPLPNETRWNSWFRMVLYTKEYINYWPHFFESELQENLDNTTLLDIHNTLQNEQQMGIIRIYIYFISIFSQEFIQTLDFFQQKNQPVFPYIETRLQHLATYLESNRTAENFGSDLHELILRLHFDHREFYTVFRAAFEAAFSKFSLHIPNHPGRELFRACRAFDPVFIHLGDIQRRNIRLYSAITPFNNPSHELLHEWGVYCGLETPFDLGDNGIENFWLDKVNDLPVLSNIALDYIWLPISSCTVERSFSFYNTILDTNRQNLSQDSLKILAMMHFNSN
jgi:hypothetical protein